MIPMIDSTTFLVLRPSRAGSMHRPSVRSASVHDDTTSGDIRAVKAQPLEALGPHANEYWHALGALCTASMDRAEFQARIHAWMPSDCIPLHNALILKLLAEASAAPTSLGRGAAQGMQAPTSPIRARRAPLLDESESDEAHEPPVYGHTGRGAKRLRHMYAGLSSQERARLQQLPKTNQASMHTAASVWAGAGAELLEKKRKEDEKRRAVEEWRRTREAKLAIGAEHWRIAAMQTAAHTETQRTHLSTSMQEALIRSAMAPHCIESHELPDVHGLQDRMTLAALEAGLPNGVQTQAAAVMLSALQEHLRTILHRALAYTRKRSTSTHSTRITMRDMTAVLDLAPHVVVEPLGQGPLERLWLPSLPMNSDTPSHTDGAHVSWADDDAVRQVARECATAKMTAHVPSTLSLPADTDREQALLLRQQQKRDALRSHVVIDQVAPLRLLDRRPLRESLAKGQTDASTPLTQAIEQHYQHLHHHHQQHHHPQPLHRHKDELFEVVDPVALLGSLCE